MHIQVDRASNLITGYGYFPAQPSTPEVDVILLADTDPEAAKIADTLNTPGTRRWNAATRTVTIIPPPAPAPIISRSIEVETPQVLVSGIAVTDVFRYTLPTNSMFGVVVELVGINASNGDRCRLKYELTLSRLSGNAIRDAIAPVVNVRVGGAAGWVVDGNVSGSDFVVTVQNPVAGQTISWRLSIQGTGSRPGGF